MLGGDCGRGGSIKRTPGGVVALSLEVAEAEGNELRNLYEGPHSSFNLA